MIDFEWVNSSTDESIMLAFASSKANDRKKWLAKYDPDTVLDYDVKQMSYKDFINNFVIKIYKKSNNIKFYNSFLLELNHKNHMELFTSNFNSDGLNEFKFYSDKFPFAVIPPEIMGNENLKLLYKDFINLENKKITEKIFLNF